MPVPDTRILIRLARACARQELTEQEVRSLLSHLGVGDSREQEAYLKFLRQYGFLDENRFLLLAYADLWETRHWGPLRIREYLLRRGIPEAQVDAFLEKHLPPAVWKPWLKTYVHETLTKNFSDRRPDKKTVLRLARQLVRMGFPPEEVQETLDPWLPPEETP